MTATLTMPVGFAGPNGEEPEGVLIADFNGDLFGMTNGANDGSRGTYYRHRARDRESR